MADARPTRTRTVARKLRARFRMTPAMGVALVALILAATGAAFATIPDGVGAIHGCYSSNGSLRVIDDASATCTASETALNWNQTGPAGPAGPTGATGATGMAGATGIGPAISGARDAAQLIYTKDRTVVTLNGIPAGKYVLVGKMWLRNEARHSRYVVCYLRAGGDFDRSATRLEANGDTATRGALAFNVVHEFTARASGATISCAANGVGAAPLNPINDAGIAEVRGYDFKISAIGVSALSNKALTTNPLA